MKQIDDRTAELDERDTLEEAAAAVSELRRLRGIERERDMMQIELYVLRNRLDVLQSAIIAPLAELKEINEKSV